MADYYGYYEENNAGHRNPYPYAQNQQQSFYSQPAPVPPVPQANPFGFPMAGQEIMMDAAKAYGGQFAQQGKEKLEKIVSINTLKYYFAVDNAYVGKKLGLLLFPFAHTKWDVQYSADNEPIAPRFDTNASDLYIPLMSIVTYILVAGMLLGLENKFSPEQLGIVASTALIWLAVENIIILFTRYLLVISSALRFYDTLAYSGYKFVSMIVCLIAYMVAGMMGYTISMVYCSVAITFFLIRSIKGDVLGAPMSDIDGGKKRKLYLLGYIALTQPFVMYWLTSSALK